MVPAEDWVPTTIWDLVIKPGLFITRPCLGPKNYDLIEMLNEELAKRDVRPMSREMAIIDPCYSMPGIPPHDADVVHALPTIKEGELLCMPEPEPRVKRSIDVGTTTRCADPRAISLRGSQTLSPAQIWDLPCDLISRLGPLGFGFGFG